jgi:hypothetical protein
MKTLRTLVVTSALLCLLAATATAGELPTGPCSPGELPTGPCQSSQVTATDDSNASGETSGPASDTVVDLVDIAEAAFWSLTLF